VTPQEAVGRFLAHLATHGIVKKDWSGWNADEGVVFRARKRALNVRGSREAVRALETTVSELAVSIAQEVPFNESLWLNSPQGKYRPSPIEVAKEGGPLGRALTNDLHRLKAMLTQGGSPANDLLGFPFEAMQADRRLEQIQEESRRKAEAEKAASKKAEREAAEARGRKSELLRTASLYLSSEELSTWFSSRLLPESGNVLDVDGLTEDQYRREESTLARELRRREIEQRERNRTAPFKASLIEEAAFILRDADHAARWADGFRRELGAKPIDYCVDRDTKAYCLNILKSTLHKRRR
jgi:hypothetical protein